MISNIQAKQYAALLEKKYRDRDGKFLVEGLRLCEELLISSARPEIVMYCPELTSGDRAGRLLDGFRQQGVPVETLAQNHLKRLTDTRQPQGIVAVVHKEQSSFAGILARHPSKVVALVSLSDPGNLGTILRSAAWFGMDAVLLSHDSVELTNPKVVRSSMGAVFHLPVAENLDMPATLATLREAGYVISLADSAGQTSLYAAGFGTKNVVVLGGETSGVDSKIREYAGQIVSIPGPGRGDSLNVSIAAGIIFSELVRRGH